jgi:hypothetical protein
MSFPTEIESGINNLYVLVHTNTSNYDSMYDDFRAAAYETGSLLLYKVIEHQGGGGKDINFMVEIPSLLSVNLFSVLFSSF